MALKTTVEHLKRYLSEISHDLEKAGRGNKAAAQRVRTNTIKFAKLAKQYRKESISEGSKGRKKTAKRKTASRKRAAPRKKTARKAAPRKKTAARKKTTRKKTARRR